MEERILVVEDETKIARFLRQGLTFEGYQVDVAYDGSEALSKLRAEPADLVILDIMLPHIDGMEVCRRLRSFSAIPVLMLTARDAVQDRVKGLDSGADDYLVKPFALDELLARIRALLRRQRASQDEPQVFSFADLKANSSTRQVWRGNREIQLTAKEYDFLEFFMRHPQQVLTRDQIYEQIWGYDFGGESNIIEVYVRYLRAKLEANGEVRLIHTVRGVGYSLREE